MVMLIAAGALVGCGGNGEGQAEHHEASHDEHMAQGGPASGGAHGLVLDEGRKWEMDAHTRAMIARMSGRLEGMDMGAMSSDALGALGGDLRADVDSLVAGCTMTGSAHDQLHTFLAAYIPAVEGMKQGDSAEATKVRELLELYPQYFE